MQKIVSVVTVCYNEKNNIEKTMRSVLNQTSNNLEYIVCDGGSTDGTIEIINDIRKEYIDRDIIVNSETDGGIYFGMNRGIELAHGRYIIFINAGDYLADSNVLVDIEDELKKKENSIIYGDCLMIERNVTKRVVCDDKDLFHDMTICHPTVFFPLNVMKERKYDTEFRIAADYEYLLFLKESNYEFNHICRDISVFSIGGVCTSQFQKSIRERCEIWNRYNVDYNFRKQMLRAKRETIVSIIKKNMPYKIWKYYNRIKGRKVIE